MYGSDPEADQEYFEKTKLNSQNGDRAERDLLKLAGRTSRVRTKATTCAEPEVVQILQARR